MFKNDECNQTGRTREFNPRATVKTNDEIGQLGDSLNKMIAKMQTLIDKLVKEEAGKERNGTEGLTSTNQPPFSL